MPVATLQGGTNFCPPAGHWYLGCNSIGQKSSSPCFTGLFYFFLVFVYFWDRERQSVSRGGAERERERETERERERETDRERERMNEFQAGSTFSTEPDVGLKVMTL